MAASDFRLCDVCSSKVFYDANLNYEPVEDESGNVRNGGSLLRDLRLEYLGDWAVICDDCAETHQCVVVPRDSTGAPHDA